MSECAVLDGPNEDGFEGWSSFSPGHQNGDGFSDWGSFQETQSAQLPVQESGSYGQDHKVQVEDGVAPWLVFHDCFYIEGAAKDTPTMEIPSLYELLHDSERTPKTTTLSREAASLCQRLLCKSQSLSISGPKPSLHSHKLLIDTLQLQHSDIPTSQCTDSADLFFEEAESSPTTLIQTKLNGLGQWPNSPGFLYQVSQQWLDQQSLRLVSHQGKKNLLL